MRVGNHRPKINYAEHGVDIPSLFRRLGSEMMENEGGPPELLLCFLASRRTDAYVFTFFLFPFPLNFAQPPPLPSLTHPFHSHSYGEIKRFGDVTMGVATQCLVRSSFLPLSCQLLTLSSVRVKGEEGEQGLPPQLRPQGQREARQRPGSSRCEFGTSSGGFGEGDLREADGVSSFFPA
jgi:hypothetical protein